VGFEIWLHLDNFNTDTEFPPSHSWYPAMNRIKYMRELKNNIQKAKPQAT
jgi:hypothetical protein